MSALEDIKARTQKATQGPWEVGGMDSGHSKYEMSWWVTAGEGDTICDMDGLTRSGNDDLAKDDGSYDAAFIAHARTDVPKLVAALEAVENALNAWGNHYDGGGVEDGVVFALSRSVRKAISEALA